MRNLKCRDVDRCSWFKMLLPRLLIFGSFVQLSILIDSLEETENATWYKGCYRSATSRRQFPVVRDYQTVPECALHCGNFGYNYSLIQTINDQFQCGCTQSLVTMETADCCDTSRMSRLQVGLRHGCWGVYETLGPYLTMVSMDTDHPVIVMNEPTTMEIFVKRAAAYNLSDDDTYTGHHLDIAWRLRQTNNLHHDIVEFLDYTEIYHSLKHIFPNPGNYTIDVHVSNGISELETSLDVEVVYPEPHDLQLGFPDGLLNLPSCIPEEYYIRNATSTVLAVFVNTSVQLEASVSLGTNLTFTFLFEDSNEEINVELLGRNLSVLQEHTFREIGTYRLVVTAENIYGSRIVTVTMIVVERQLSDLHINLEPSNHFIATVGTPIWFNISVITTTRDNLYLQVWYGDGANNIVSLSDTDRPALILTGDGKDMEIAADYGDGCEFIVEFSYLYMQEGLYKPRAAILDKFDESLINRKMTEVRHADSDADYLDKMNSEDLDKSDDNYKENSQYALGGFPDIISEGVVNDNPRSRFGSYSDLQVFENIIEVKDPLHVQNNLDNINADYKNNGSFQINKELLSAELERNIIIVEKLDGIRLHGPNIVSCIEMRQFILEVPSKFNVSVHWRVYRVYEQDLENVDGDGATDYNVMYQMVHETEGAIFIFNYSFTEVGQYVITAQVSNVLSNTETKHNILSMCPVSNLKASCNYEYIQTGHELMCYAEASSGSKLIFEWIIDGYNTEEQFRVLGNYSSIFRYTFTQPDICDISVTAVNNISLAHVIVEPPIRIQDSITDFVVLRNIWAIVGQPVNVMTTYQPTSIYNQCCYFGFNFGETEIHGLEGIFHKTLGCFYMSDKIQFEELGRHFVKVYAYNRVSNMTKIIDFWAIPSLKNVSIEIISNPTENNHLRLLVKDQGKAMVTENVYFSWKFEGEAVYFTNSPLIEVSVTGIGESSLNLNASTPVESEVFTVPLNESSTTKSGFHIEHDLFVSLGNTTEFIIQKTLSQCSKVFVNYSDGTSEIYKGGIQSWKPTFETVGLQQITVTLADDDGTSLDNVTTYVMVEEPIQTISLHGPSIVKISEAEGSSPNKWTAELDGGTNVLYRWTLEETLLTTLPEFEKEITRPGNYKLQVEAWNDISEPVTTYITLQVIQIEHPIKDAQLKVIGSSVGKETQILTSIIGHQPFVVNVSFGDGYYRELIGHDLHDALMSLSDNRYIVTIGHVYTEPGEFNITVNIFNNVSSVIVWDVFVPIENVTIVTRSPWLVRVSDLVRVRGEVEGGQDLNFQWNFQNDYHETFVSFDNQTSIATHSYDWPGEYLVSFNVTGKHYPPPGISVVLERPFLVVDPISQVILDVMKNSAELIGNSTSPAIFNAKSTGSHVRFHFDFGDGIQVEVAGSQHSMTEVHLTTTAETRHVFRKEGQFKVKVTATNPIGNMTEYLNSPFHVQKPPRNLYFCHADIYNLPVTSYTGRVGQDIQMCANVTMGTNVTFDWKLGDQTDMVKHGSFITHRYSTPGIRTVYVTAKNKVNKAEKAIKVYVNYQLQGVDLVPSKSVVALGEMIQYTAVVRPDYNNTASDYTWKFMFPSKSATRERSESTIHSEQNSIYYTFKKESGICFAKVTARNAISRVSSDTVEIHVIDKIKRLEINLPGNTRERLVNKTLLFHSYLFAGTNVTFTWDFGDGSEKVSTSAAYINHTYTKQNGYNITLNASNPVGTQTVSMLLFVLEQSFCNQPDTTIINQPGSKIQYSKPFTVEANVVPDCNLTSMLEYTWLIDGQPRKDLQSDKRILVLPPRYLTFGIHSIQFMVKMNKTIVYAVKNLEVEVVPSPLISKIQGGIYRRIGRSGTIILDGSGSLDPNTDNNQSLRYSWSCRYTSESGDQGNVCFLQDESLPFNNCNISMMSALLIFPRECLIEASNFTFNLTVTADDRQSSSVYQILSVTQDNTLDVKILRPSLVEPVNADRKLSFYVECSNCPPRVKFRWSLKHVFNFNSYNPARAHDLKCVEANGTTYYIVMQHENGNGTILNGLTESEQQQKIDTEGFVGPINQAPVDSNTPQRDWTVNQNNSPVFIDGHEITEGDPGSDILNRRRRESNINNKYMYWMYSANFNISEGIPEHKSRFRRQTRYDGYINMSRHRRSLASESTTFSYPSVLQEGDPGSRTIKFPVPAQYEISENTDTNPSRRIPDLDNIPIREGSPGESGSSGPRQYGGVSISITEGQGSSRNPNLPEEDDPMYSSSADDRNRIETVKSSQNQVYTILDQRPILAYLKAEQTKTGLNSESLVIKPGVLKQGLTYIVELHVQHEDLGLEGEAKSSFVVNESPVEGRCSIEPQSGIELNTEFTLLCKEWRDEHKPFMYEVGYREDQNSDMILIYRGVNNDVSFKLPAGTQNNDHKVFVSIDILDALHAKTSVCSIAIQVKPKSYTSLKKLLPEFASYTEYIYDEVTNKNSSLQKSLEKGDDAMSKVYISYLATKLNKFKVGRTNVTKSDTTLNSKDKTIVDRSVGESVAHGDLERKVSLDDVYIRRDIRTYLLKILKTLPVRDEAEILQSAQALAFTTAVPTELCPESLDISLEILKSVTYGAHRVYGYDDLTPTGNLIPVVVQSAASIISATRDIGQAADEALETVLKDIVTDSIDTIESLVMNELKFHMTSEDPILTSTDFLSVLATRHVSMQEQSLEISDAKFQFPENFAILLDNQQENKSSQLSNQKCFQSHMTTFQKNPYSWTDNTQVNSVVSGLKLFDCLGTPLLVEGLPHSDRIQVELPNLQPQNGPTTNLVLRKWSMNIHQFNVSLDNLKHALHLVVEFVPVQQGRIFSITVLLSYDRPPNPKFFLYKYDVQKTQNVLDIFLPPGSFNVTGKYFIGIVDATFNSGRLRAGEVTYREYGFKLWWGECLYWNVAMETWQPDGCSISRSSSYKVTKCECSHLTAFGSRFDLIPNKLSHEDVDNFFSPNKNPVVLTLISIVFIMYFVLLLWCCHADQHDSQKGGVVYLLDNAPMDQQKYEVTVETGIHGGAGTTAKISLILHGEEGMSETRELISEDNRPMFERNSRDKFILTLPDSIGKIWKVQIWHNNFGESPSWYVTRIIVRDLNTGVPYIFICEKWLAVEEEDGKVEREFMALEGSLDFRKALMSKTSEYMADFHVWLSILTCPSHSGFKRTERLTLCLTITLMYMCLNAAWYKTSVTEYRGEFGLLDVSLRNVTVGAIICGMVIPVALVLEFLFRRSKPKHASSVTSKDEVEDWDHEYPSGKPNEQDSEDTSEHVPPVMTYSLLDQSIMNWPNIQTWAQKQWMKRQQSHLTNNPFPNDRTEDGLGNIIKPTAAIVGSPIVKQAMSEMDQASSGFEDCNSLIRPKASMDSTHTTAAPSVAESMRTHKPKSLPDSLRMSKPDSEMDSTRTSKAPSISSSGSHKSSVMNERKCRRNNTFYLPYWCRYIAWTVCGILCVGSAVITAMYGYRFGVTKSTMWLQSLFFSAMICVFISTPLLIIIAVIHAAIRYRNDPTTVLDIYDIFNRVKAKQDLLKWKKQMEMWFEGDALDRAVSARQRSRYLRFARPPQEKQLIEARKKVIKEKKALSVFRSYNCLSQAISSSSTMFLPQKNKYKSKLINRESVMFVITIFLLLVMAYSKNTGEKYSLNKAVKTRLCKTGSPNFLQIKSHSDWYTWTQTGLLDSLDVFDRLGDRNQSMVSSYKESNYLIGSVQLRQQRVHSVSCPEKLPYVTSSCLGNYMSHDQNLVSNISSMRYQNGFLGNLIFGNYSIYDGSGYVVSLNTSRATAAKQLDWLQNNKWLDRTTRALFVEFTVYNAPRNLFIAVDLLLELPPIGVTVPIAKVTSTHVFRYTSTWDNVLLACELLFFLVTMVCLKKEVCRMMKKQKKYFILPWNILNIIICVISLVFCLCYVYRFVIVSATVEVLRNTYYEQYVDVSFITMWDEILRWLVGVLIFLFTVKSLRLLRYTKLFVVFGDVYRKARREIILFFALFSILQAGYASMGHVLFGSAVRSYRNIWISLMAVTALLTGNQKVPDNWEPANRLSTNIFLFCVCIFMMGLLMAYMVAILSHYFKSRKKRRLLAMSGQEAMLFYWTQFQYLVGLKKNEIQEEPEVILPPEFTMAEIEYQVDELLFRMNALSGTHGLPEKPPCYLTDSDCTYGAGDDGISSGGSEPIPTYIDDRLEQRVQKIEDNLCSQEPFLAQLLKFDAVGMDMLSQEKEKQLRSHLELEIFRQLQIQRQDLRVSDHKTAESKTKYDSQKTKSAQSAAEEGAEDALWNMGQESTSSDEAKLLPSSEKSSRPKYGPSNITIQAIQDLLAKSAQDYKDFHNENSSSNPDSPRDKLAFTKSRKDTDNKMRAKQPQNSSTSSSEKISPDLSLNHSNIYDKDNIKKPTKPTFLHSRDSSLSDAQKNSPILKLRTHNIDKSAKLEPSYTGVERLIESSSGSEQDGFQVGRKLLGKRSLRKTKSRGKGKGADEGLGPGLLLDELDCEEGDFSQEFSVEGLHKELMDVYEERMKELKTGGTEHLVRADVHHSSDSQ